jgi:hypothetical protein
MNESNLTTNETVSSKKNDIFSVIVGYYVFNVMLWLGAALNSISVVIFSKIVRTEQSNQGHLFKYLLLKSIMDCIFCVVNLPRMIYYQADFGINESYIMQLWFRFVYYYIYCITSQLSVWFEIAASIDCVCLIARKFPWHKMKACFICVTPTFIIGFTLFYIPYLFFFEVEKNDHGGYYPKVTSFGNSKFIYYHLLVHSITRDIIPVFISIILNSIILYYIRQLTLRRKNMTVTSTTMITTQAALIVKKSQKAERNKIQMMFVTSFIHVFRVPLIFYNFNMLNVLSNVFVSHLCLLSICFSYFIPIFTYIGFNNTFRKYFAAIFFLSKCCKSVTNNRN